MIASTQIFIGLDHRFMGLGIFKDSKVERGRELFLGFYLVSNFGLYSKEDFLTETAKVGNRGLTEATSGGLSDKFQTTGGHC